MHRRKATEATRHQRTEDGLGRIEDDSRDGVDVGDLGLGDPLGQIGAGCIDARDAAPAGGERDADRDQGDRRSRLLSDRPRVPEVGA